MKNEKKYIFNAADIKSNIRLDLYLYEQGIFSSRNIIQNLIKKNQVFVNGDIKKASFKINPYDEITVICSDDNELFFIEPENVALNIVYEDNDILVVNKPKNMLTHPTTREIKGTLANALLYKYGYEGLSDINGIMRPGIVHRLDRNTSGLLMVAKNNIAHKFLSEQIKTKTAIRKYLAIVNGNFDNCEGIIDLPIARSIKNPEKMAVMEGGKPSVTKYKVIEIFKGFSFIELTLLTGRTHQIRVHLSYIGHPIVNDTLYNKQKIKLKTIEQVLQAYKLQFTSLNSNDIINLEIEPDEDVKKVLNFLRSQK